MRQFYLLMACFLAVSSGLMAQQGKVITGRINVASEAQSVQGVTITEKSTSNSVVSDANGNFSIRLTRDNSSLIISSVGSSTKEISVGNSSFLNVQLSQSQATLDEVVVTALGISREKKALGYASQQVGTAELNKNHQPNLVNALQGKVAGATISSVGGGPGQGATIRIRGVNSIDVTQSNDPLFVIDGIILDNSTSTLGSGSGYNVRSVGNRASDINPDDIETINILKGGAATALYGLRGANGVVVITTKKGKGDGVRVNFTSTYGFDNINKTPEIQQIYTAGILGVYTPIGLGPAWGPTIAEAKLIDSTHPDKLYDNYEQAYRTGSQLRNSINISGGSEAVKFFSSLSYFTQEGMLPFTDYQNISARLNTDIKVSSKIRTSVNMSFTNSGGYKYDADRFGESLAYFFWSLGCY